jgi:hypothetical protein
VSDRPICFVIAPIGKDGSEIRARSDRILKYVISPVAEECGYTAIRADNISEPGMITTQVINHILNDPMVVADLTDENANVFYELAVRHAIRKPFVQIIEKGQRIPFDVAGLRTIEIDHRDLESVSNAKDEMKRQILAAGTSAIESPISVAVDFDRLRRSGDPAERQLADVLEALNDLKATVETRLPARILPSLKWTEGPKGLTGVVEAKDLVDSLLGEAIVKGLSAVVMESLAKSVKVDASRTETEKRAAPAEGESAERDVAKLKSSTGE